MFQPSYWSKEKRTWPPWPVRRWPLLGSCLMYGVPGKGMALLRIDQESSRPSQINDIFDGGTELKLEIVSKNENKLMDRVDVNFKTEHSGEGPPTAIPSGSLWPAP